MNKFAKFVLWLLAIFSVCMLLFRWGVIPPFFGETENAEAKNEVMLNLSYSYLAGLIFYILVTWLPNKVRTCRMQPFIKDKKEFIAGKMENCADGIIPTSMLLNHKPTRDELIKHLEQNSLLTAPTFISLIGPQINIQTYWRLQRDEIRNHIQELMVYKEYLTDDDLQALAKLQDCEFFYMINAIFPQTDTPQTRKKIASELWDAIIIARRLK